jgi:hypothetical protein
MKNLFKSYLLAIVIFAIGSVIFIISVFNQAYADPKRSQAVFMDPQYAANYSDDRILMGASHDVFVGKILRESGTQARGSLPQTQFEVQIISNVKGPLQGVVVLNQVGGYENGRLYSIENNDIPGISSEDGPNYLLQPGATYLLATRYNPTEHWYTLNSFPTASKLLTTNSALSTVQLQSLAADDSRVQQLQAAYPHEILLQADVAHNNTLNSYASTHPVIQVQIIPTSTTVISPATTSQTMLVAATSTEL